MDTCPDQIKAPAHLEGAITSINLVPLPTSAFPTYRLCNGNEAAWRHLREAGCGTEDPGVFCLKSSLVLTPEDVDVLYFHDESQGRSGAIKKRGPLCRLDL